MYAIVETGGKQYRVRPGDTIAVERMSGEPGDTLDLDRVLLVGGDGDETRLGSPALEGAVVRAEVIEHGRGQKIIVFRYKSKVRYRRKTGHRQPLTRLRITDILLDKSQPPAAAESETAASPRRRRAAAVAEAPAEEARTEAAPQQAAAEAAPEQALAEASAEQPAAAEAAPEQPAAAEAAPEQGDKA
jgi:large subunit ribosomal protein L21